MKSPMRVADYWIRMRHRMSGYVNSSRQANVATRAGVTSLRTFVVVMSCAAATLMLWSSWSQPLIARQAAARSLRLSMDANPRSNSDYGRTARTEAIRLLGAAGANHFHYSVSWSRVERQPGVFTLTDERTTLNSSSPLPVAFTLKVIDAGTRQVPDAYRSLAWDSPEMVFRVSRLIDQVAPLLGSRPWSYAIGNEIELYFARHPDEIGAFARMLELLKPLVRLRHPGASFTTVWQLSAVGDIQTTYAPVFATLDHVALTYYPLNPDLTVRPPDAVYQDLAFALERSSPLPIALQEIGYPTAALLGSSQEQQRDFMRNAFDAVSAVGPERVLGVTYLFQSDLPQWLVNDLVRAYQFDTANFRAFLTTLGLRDDRDRPKLAWNEFVRQAQVVRGAIPPR
jgi:hypothetical protein